MYLRKKNFYTPSKLLFLSLIFKRMSVETILYQLLLEHECVILPNFGGFIVRESPCNYNATKEIIKPYSKSIFFNQHLLENDGLLINAISRIKDKSYTDATIELEAWVKQLSEQIENEGKHTIKNIGSFTKGSEGNKWFAADPTLNLSLQTYGLRPVKAAIISESIFKEEEPIFEIKPLADNKPIETFTIKRTNWKAWVAAASIALVAHIGYLTIEGFQSKTSNQAAIITLPSTTVTEVAPAEANVQTDTMAVVPEIIENAPEMVQPIIEETAPTTVIESTPIEPAIAKTETTTSSSEEQIIEPAPILGTVSDSLVGRYKLEVNALNHIKDLSKLGIIGRVEKNDQGLFEVKVSSNN